eukprot:m.15779 g.15779  ORF g.15779 m.15779 type:complete len:256 (+) comp4523_c0_seq1:61-828(+)
MTSTWADLQGGRNNVAVDHNNYDGGKNEGVYPDIVNYGAHVSACSVEIRMGFLRKVYGIVAAQLTLTTIFSVIASLSPTAKAFVQTNESLLTISMLGSFASLISLFFLRKSYPSNFLLLSIFTFFESYLVAAIVTFYEGESVLQAFVLTACVVVGLTMYTFQTKRDFTIMHTFLVTALWMLIGLGFIMAVFPPSELVSLVYGFVGAAVFSLFIIVDTQLLLKKRRVDEYIMCAIDLYLDIINLFLEILKIVGKRN